MSIDKSFNKIEEVLENVKEVDIVKYTELLIETKKVRELESIRVCLNNIDNTLMANL